jgi:hypothetical protein
VLRFVDLCFSFCPLSFGHCLSFIFWPLFVLYLLTTVCPSHNGFWLHFNTGSGFNMEHCFNDMCEMGYDSRLGLVLVVLTYMYMFVCSLYLLTTVCPSHNGFWLHFVVSSNCLYLNVRALQFNY